MRPLWLDYQRPAPTRRRAGFALLAAGVLASGAALADYFAVADGIDTARAQVATLRQAAAQPRPADAAAPAAVAAAHPAGQWEALFSSLEAAGDESVTLLGLRPGATEIQITGEAKNFAASADYVRRLQTVAGLSRPQLTQSELVLDHPQRPVRFALVAQWREAGQ